MCAEAMYQPLSAKQKPGQNDLSCSWNGQISAHQARRHRTPSGIVSVWHRSCITPHSPPSDILIPPKIKDLPRDGKSCINNNIRNYITVNRSSPMAVTSAPFASPPSTIPHPATDLSEAQIRFLSALAPNKSIRRAAREAGVDRDTVSSWLKNPNFKSPYDRLRALLPRGSHPTPPKSQEQSTKVQNPIARTLPDISGRPAQTRGATNSRSVTG